MAKCFFLEPTDQVVDSLRRYASGDNKCDKSGYGYHNASTTIGQRQAVKDEAIRCGDNGDGDPRWPTHCACGYEFKADDQWQRSHDALFKRQDTGELVTLRAAPTGAMWYASWYSGSPQYAGPDGKTLVVKLPGNRDWIIDYRASNCDSPCTKCGIGYKDHHGGLCRPGVPYSKDNVYEDARPHKCWVRHGEPPNVHVDKNGVTCGAGAGSIDVGHYHGFLHNGELTGC